jgi:pyruvate kinase
MSSVDQVIHRMGLLWGVHPIKCPKLQTAEQMVDQAEELLERGGFVKPKEILGIVAGTRTRSGSTNFLRLHVLGDRLTETISPHRETAAKKASKKTTAKKIAHKKASAKATH